MDHVGILDIVPWWPLKKWDQPLAPVRYGRSRRNPRPSCYGQDARSILALRARQLNIGHVSVKVKFPGTSRDTRGRSSTGKRAAPSTR